MEIERKFLIHLLPFDLSQYPFSQIEQGYISIDPVIRIRKEDESFHLTFKSKGFLQREEINISINEEKYYHLVPKIDHNLITKKRYLIPLGNDLIAELDLFESYLEGLILVEVEFSTKEAAVNFNPPSWFGEEVTFESSYHNNHLCQLTSLEDLV